MVLWSFLFGSKTIAPPRPTVEEQETRAYEMIHELDTLMEANPKTNCRFFVKMTDYGVYRRFILKVHERYTVLKEDVDEHPMYPSWMVGGTLFIGRVPYAMEVSHT